MQKYLILVLIAAIGIFAEFQFLGSVGSSLVEIILFLGLLYLTIVLWREQSAETPVRETTSLSPTAELPRKQYRNPVFDIKPASLIDAIESETRLHQFLQDQFFIVWNFLLPHNGYVFYAGKQGTFNPFIKQLRADLQWKEMITMPAALQLVESSGDEILIENNLEPGSPLMPYYKDQDYTLRALLGFKIEFSTGECLYFLFDAEEANFFNSEELGVLKRVIQTIRLVVNALLSDKGIQNQFISTDRKLVLSLELNKAGNLSHAIDIFTDFIAEEFEASKLTIALRSQKENDKAEIQKSVGIEDIFKKGYVFSLDEGLNGWVIQKNKAYHIDNIDKGEYFIPRFSKDEKSNYGIKSFLSVPLRNNKEAIGVVTLEHQNARQFDETHMEILEEFVRIFSASIPRLMN